MKLQKSKIQNLKDLEFYAHMDAALNLIKKWKDKSPHNKEINLMSESLIGIFFWANTMEQEVRVHDAIVSQYRDDRNNTRLELQELKNKYEHLKKLEL
jgi:hypothetical protein|tara:strand:- start:3 stop:296 length:294 start_codon:yes stop_codon:yes gene_type:complete